MKATIHIGTSGWSYKHWMRVFYPASTSVADQFKYLRKYFDTVEINNSFYRLPSAAAFKNWKKLATPGFLFAVKASRYITHMKKLTGGSELFIDRIENLGSKLGPVLFQLPPKWNCNPERLSEFIEQLPKRHKFAFEFRNTTWYTEEVYSILRKHNCAFCVYELGDHLSPEIVTADFVYVRLHGPGTKYAGSYSLQSLRSWAKKCKKWKREGRNVFVYFDNDAEAHAVFNALKLKELVQRK